MSIRRRLVPLAVAAPTVTALPVAFAVAATTGTPGQGDPGSNEPGASASVVRVDTIVPPREKVIERGFRLWIRPTPGQVREIIRNEARRWHVPAASLTRRVACESRFHWWASNGQYQGVLQFSSNAFYRGLHTIRDRRIKIVRQKVRRVHETRVTHYSDGHTVSRRTTPRRQRVTVVYTGKLPRTPSVSNTFAQVRIGAQALRGISAVQSSEWSCGA
jgi:hypothetical protein